MRGSLSSDVAVLPLACESVLVRERVLSQPADSPYICALVCSVSRPPYQVCAFAFFLQLTILTTYLITLACFHPVRSGEEGLRGGRDPVVPSRAGGGEKLMALPHRTFLTYHHTPPQPNQMKIDAFTCHMMVDGKPLQEHRPKTSRRFATCWVESEDNKVRAHLPSLGRHTH